MKEVIEHLERMAETLDGVTEENWLDTPEDIAQIYRSVANEIKQKMSAQNQSVTNCNQLQPNKVENAENNHIRLNMAKSRDALRKVISLYKSWANKALSSSEEVANNYLMSACHVAMDALAAPPRNCDVYTEAQLCKKVTEEIKSELGNIPQGILDIVDIVAKGMIRGLFAEAKGDEK